MHHVRTHLKRSADQFARHPFFALLRPTSELRHALAFARGLSFWVYVFQDVIRLNADLARDPRYRALLLRHCEEDRGHEQWFHADLLEIFGAPVALDELFAPEFADARAGALAIAAEVFRLSDDRLRIVLVDALEAAAGVGFARFAAHVRASGCVDRLQYFDGRHLAVEDDHELHDEHVERELDAIRFTDDERAEAAALIDRVFAAFARIFTALMPSMTLASLAA
ncbi:hypothetical protein [Nannocystis punicea]|uniref:Iron-containing redox enzyme n=1 Tax=Nannocystis punicea TaxID=2995304 RepID=A0ABY7HJE9_9BACT|nr:hypothetical protein [Nannocystis poenicansa]WAS99185.1 hypothetical protein O0S08_23910 [Nannocystis poenicansa]